MTNGFIFAQDFSVAIEATAQSDGYFTPIKAGNSFQFQIRIKNNLTDTCTVSIVESNIGLVQSWVSIDDNSQSLLPSQSKNFLLTVSVPSGTQEDIYTMFLYFNATDQNGGNHNFNHSDSPMIIVDNSAPSPPDFTLSTLSNTSIGVNSWSSWDTFSSIYTNHNTSAGIDGIKEYKITIKNPDGSTK